MSRWATKQDANCIGFDATGEGHDGIGMAGYRKGKTDERGSGRLVGLTGSARFFAAMRFMRFGIFFAQAAAEFFLVAGAAKTDTVCRCCRLFFFFGACFSVGAGHLSKLRNFYYIFVVRNHTLPANPRQLAVNCSLNAHKNSLSETLDTGNRWHHGVLSGTHTLAVKAETNF